jgi:hypothetical protein
VLGRVRHPETVRRVQKVSAVIVTLAICVAFCHRGVEASASQCYYCLHTCDGTLQVETCPDSVNYVCISASAEGSGMDEAVKGCIPSSDSSSRANCDLIDENGGDCFICDTDLCNSAGIYSVSVLLVSCLVFLLTKIL